MDYDSVNLEILRMARELVVNEYTDQRAEMHNKWLVESEHLWRTQRLRLPYPTIPSPPTEKDILEIANTLMKFVMKPTETTVVEDPLIIEEILPIEEEPPCPMPIEEEPPVKELPLPDPKPLPEEPAIPANTSSGRVLPRVLQKLDEMKRNLF